MDNKRPSLQTKTSKIALALCVAALGVFTGCIGHVDGPRAGVYVEPVTFAVEDDYVYYPRYECYYSVSRHQYAYRNHNTWVARPAPRGVSVNVVMASPSVRMNFHDSPAQHHAMVAKQYPKNWKPTGSNEDQRQKENQRNEHDDHHGK